MYLEELIKVCLKLSNSDTNVFCHEEVEQRGVGERSIYKNSKQSISVHKNLIVQ